MVADVLAAFLRERNFFLLAKLALPVAKVRKRESKESELEKLREKEGWRQRGYSGVGGGSQPFLSTVLFPGIVLDLRVLRQFFFRSLINEGPD